ncbi:MAG: glycosyltransferase family 2 protein [Elusimicrobiota bacterium]|jgi:glycosyltransferase involved in cell wall biosynthesis|nr:glycosyltransferase family 2 protein [Elusimicrobiota bacterium]
MFPKVSVIVPVHNTQEEHLRQCIESVINQTLKEIEIILVNNGSTNNSLEVFEDYAKQDERIIIINQENLGLSGSRNSGLRVAKGECIGFIDSDDWIEDNYYELLYNALKKENADIAIAKDVLWMETAEEPFLEENFRMCVWDRLFRGEIIKKNNLTFELHWVWGEDTIFNFKALMFSNKEVFVDSCLYYYRREHNYNVTKKAQDEECSNPEAKYYMDLSAARQRIIDFYNTFDESPKVIKCSLRFFLGFIINWPCWKTHKYVNYFQKFSKTFNSFKYAQMLMRRYPSKVFNYILAGDTEKFYKFINNKKKHRALEKMWDENFEPFRSFRQYRPNANLSARIIFKILKRYITNINSVIEIGGNGDAYKNQFAQIFSKSLDQLNYCFNLPEANKELNQKFDLAIAFIDVSKITPQEISQTIDTLTKTSDTILFCAVCALYDGGKLARPQGYYQSLFAQKNFLSFDIFRQDIWNFPFISWEIRQNLILYISTDKTDIFKQKGIEPTEYLEDIFTSSYLYEMFKEAQGLWSPRTIKYRKRYQSLQYVVMGLALIIIICLII